MSFGSQPVARLRDRLREETSSAILSAAEAVIGEAGLHAAKMERIAASAGVSVGTLYNHFKDREALIDALRASRVRGLQGRVASALEASRGQPTRARVRALLSAMASHGREHGPFFAALMAESQGPSRLRAPIRVQSVLLPAIEEILGQGEASGEVRPDAAGIRADALVALARLVLARTVEGRGGEAEIDGFTELFLSGIAR